MTGTPMDSPSPSLWEGQPVEHGPPRRGILASNAARQGALALGTVAAGLVVVIALLVITSVCEPNVAPRPVSDSTEQYHGGEVPVDDNVYTIRGVVIGQPIQMVRLVEPAYVKESGELVNAQAEGKSLVRLLVHDVDPETRLATTAGSILLKATDIKAAGLQPNDVVTFRCRAQYEAVAAVRKRETFQADRVGTWELDYCRLATPLVSWPLGER